MTRAWLALAVLAGCTTFEDPDIVVDLRVIAMSAVVDPRVPDGEGPEQIVDVDLANPQQPAMLLGQLVQVQVCALVADPGYERQLRWSMTLCSYGDDLRCSTDVPTVIGSGVVNDPETSPTPVVMCSVVNPNANLLAVLLDALEGDQLGGLGGVYYPIQLSVGGADADPSLDLFAAKALVVAPRIPMGRTPNNNPSLDRIDAVVERADAVPLGLDRCAAGTPALSVRAGDTIRLTPIEPAGAREVYMAPTFDGQGRVFTESLTYQWVATAGGFSEGSTGGPRDFSGNPPPLFSDWRAPRAADLAGPTDVSIWIIQRDERLGVRWYETCIHVEL